MERCRRSGVHDHVDSGAGLFKQTQSHVRSRMHILQARSVRGAHGESPPTWGGIGYQSGGVLIRMATHGRSVW